MALKRRIKKLRNSQVAKITGRQMLVCKQCGIEEVKVPADVISIICSYCVQKMVAPPVSGAKEKSNKPRGWHFKMFFEHEGVVYSKGKIVTDEEKITELRNLKNTVTNDIPKKNNKQKKITGNRGKKNDRITK